MVTFQVTFLSQTQPPPQPSGCAGRLLCGGRARKRRARCHDSPVEIHPLLGELPVAMVRILKVLILDDLHPFSSVALFMAVLADHIQLSDSVLQNTR